MTFYEQPIRGRVNVGWWASTHNLIPIRFLASIYCLKIPALVAFVALMFLLGSRMKRGHFLLFEYSEFNIQLAQHFEYVTNPSKFTNQLQEEIQLRVRLLGSAGNQF